ncbi:Dynamin family [Teratosphaeria destructans]|uniref:Dynamin family n=1 Tax=Teratosphaeria destructans TaxID=418781 RepID=A0A9W7SVX5_9PEZI|nr:Dynamin family [Teratosphaeria destructans]
MCSSMIEMEGAPALLHDVLRLSSEAVPDRDAHLAKSADHVIIAIERHDKDGPNWTEAEAMHKFVWVKGRVNVKVRRIRDAYVNGYNGQQLGPIALRLGDSTPADNCSMNETGQIQERHIVFTAQEADQQPSTPTPARQPLQPVNRQPSYPAMDSGEDTKPLGKSPQARLATALPGVDADQSSVAPAPVEARENLPEIHPRAALPGPVGHDLATTPPAVTPTVKPEPTAEDISMRNIPETHDTAPLKQPKQEDSQEAKYQAEEHNPFLESAPHQDDAPLRGRPLQDLTKEVVPEKLEAAVQAGMQVLSELSVPLKTLEHSADAQGWLEQIEKVKEQGAAHRTVVGVVGNTGAGKSSVINAMLDEERLVPTNCMRACTAVVTELSYNYVDHPAAKYRAEIEFISPDDWRKELRILFQEIIDENGHIIKEASNPDSEAGVALAKIRAVYHKFTKEMLGKASVESLMRVKHVQSVLGTTRRVNEREPTAFYRRLQHYVDSKEKGSEKKDKNGNKITNPKREFEFWPLIKRVKIYTKASALETGAVIVDLPGVHDSNAARAAVAESYIKQCTGLWIVAPINRAVDDKAAKSLLGDTFKRQLKYDGSYSAVTFICSKTDDISRTEATDSLDLGEEMAELDDQLSELANQRKSLERELKDAKDKKKDHSDAMESIDDQLEAYEERLNALENGETVYPPSPKKRKRASKQTARKRRKSSDSSESEDDGDDDYVEISHDQDDDVNDIEIRIPLTAEQVEKQIDGLKSLKKEARRERNKFDDQIRELNKRINPIKEQESAIDAKQSLICIAGRNDYSRSAIQQDFAAGIRELDQENAEEEDPESFNPDEDVRDYEKVARDLPVFCVSSRAYQQLSGRLLKDKKVPGFESLEQTEVPRLQAHCKKLTVHGRQASCRRFLNSINQLLTSMGLWSSDDGSGANMTNKQRDHEREFLKRKLHELEKALEKGVSATLEDVESTIDEQLLEKFPAANKAASQLAVPTSSGWGAHRNDGGLYWATYKATVRRQGVFSGAAGPKDFNAELTEPLYKQLATAWEKAFQRRLPNILKQFDRSGSDLLKKFHAAVAARCRERGHGLARLGMLENQLQAYRAIFGDLASTMINQVNEKQREINREFTPIIARIMEPVYTTCTDESGPGQFKRMKSAMFDHVTSNSVTMFEDAAKEVRKSIKKMCDNVRSDMLDRADAIYLSMQRDYMSIIGGVKIDTKMPREERLMRREIDEVIGKADTIFQRVVDADAEDLKKAPSAEASDPGGQQIVYEDDTGDKDDIIDDDDEQGREMDECEEGASDQQMGPQHDSHQEDASDNPQEEQ